MEKFLFTAVIWLCASLYC